MFNEINFILKNDCDEKIFNLLKLYILNKMIKYERYTCCIKYYHIVIVFYTAFDNSF